MNYQEFLYHKSQLDNDSGFEPIWIPDFLFDFQKSLVEWAINKGRAAIFADCGLGKTPMQLVWAQNVVEKTNKPVLILTPLAVGGQTLLEGQKFNIPCERSRDGPYYQRGIVITNYEKLHLFDSSDFGGVVCDESSILKSFDGKTKAEVTEFMRTIPYRLLCTATAAPNDYIELGTSSEALGEMGHMDMLNRFFKNDNSTSDTKGHWRGFHAPRSYEAKQWRFKGHSQQAFWRWICSWARACRKPSDLGFDDAKFKLPELIQQEHVVETRKLPLGKLFALPTTNMQEEREERRRTIQERCEMAAALAEAHPGHSVIWCHLNDEGDLLEKLIPKSVQVSGKNSDEFKEESFARFRSGEIKNLIIKPKIGAWGLNWEHCNHVVTFASHSYEQYYQAVRRCWRFGQKRNVIVDQIITEGEIGIKENLLRKSRAVDKMFSELVSHMNDSLKIDRENQFNDPVEVPSWL